MRLNFDIEKFRNVLMISMISVLMGQFYISPFNIGFRLTFAVFFMSLFLIYFENYSVMMITMSVGISTFLFRTIVYYLGSDISFFLVVIQYLPVLSYYNDYNTKVSGKYLSTDIINERNKQFLVKNYNN